MGILRACDEVCGKKRGRRSKGDTYWWNEVVKEEFLKRMKYTRQYVKAVVRRIRRGIKA